MENRLGRRSVAPPWRRSSSPVWMMAVKDGVCYFLIQKVSIKHPFLCTETSLVSCSLHTPFGGEHVSTTAGLMGGGRASREDCRLVHVRPLKSVTVVILDMKAVSNRLVCVRGESFPETAVIEEKCNYIFSGELLPPVASR